MRRTQGLPALSVALLLFMGACGDGANQPSTESLEGLKVDLQQDRASVIAAHAELALSINDLEAKLTEIQSTRLSLKSRSQLEQEDASSQEALVSAQQELMAAQGELDETERQLNDLKQGSSEFRSLIEEASAAFNHASCRKSIDLAYQKVRVYDTSALDSMYDNPEISRELFDANRELFELSEPIGCPAFWFNEDDEQPTFASETAVRRAVCPTVDAGLLARDPLRYRGSCLTGWGNVVQFDSNTGSCGFHANIGERNTSWWNYEHRAQFATDSPCSWLDDIDVGSKIQWWAAVKGTYTYDTIGGGSSSVPDLYIFYVRW